MHCDIPMGKGMREGMGSGVICAAFLKMSEVLKTYCESPIFWASRCMISPQHRQAQL